MKRHRTAMTIIWMMAVAGLAAPSAYAAPAVQAAVGAGAAFPPPDPMENATHGERDTLIGPLDTLDIAVYRIDGLTRTVQVNSNGEIDYPLIGTITAMGKTADALATEIAAKLGARYVEAPQVTVFIKQSQSQKITVTGAVLKPGVYDATGRLTLMQAIAIANGTGEFANKRSVVVFRMINHRRTAGLFSLAAIQAGKVDDPEIYPGDAIVVAESNSKRRLHDIIGLAPLFVLLSPLGI